MSVPEVLIQQARDVLRQNLVVTADGHRYTRPAPMTYEQQWLWDSCFHAVVNTHLDPALAQDEIEALLAHQLTDGPDAGMVPHMTYWDGGGTPLWGREDRSTITQPPVIAYAVERVFQATGDLAFLARVYPALRAYHDWWQRRRDPDGDGLVSLIHPWETGWDASPAWDAPMGLRAPADTESRQARMALVATLAALDYDIEAAQAAGLFNVESCDLNALYQQSLACTARLADHLGRAEDAEHCRRLADRTAAAIQSKCWDEAAGVFRDLSGPDETPLPELTATTFVPLFAGIPTAQQAARLVAHLTDPAEFWPAYPIPTVALSEPLFAPDRYWRGPSWVHLNWLLYHGLRRYGYDDVAADLAQRTFAMVEAAGFWEYYNPLTGAGLGAHPQSWTALVVDMISVHVERIAPVSQPLLHPDIERQPVAPPPQYAGWQDEEELDDTVMVRRDDETSGIADEGEYPWGGDGSDLTKPIRAHVEPALVPTDAPYPPPLDQLLHLGDPDARKDIKERIAALGLTQAHVPDLVRMTRDRALNTAWSTTDEVWAPIHALTALGSLDISSVVPDLIPLFDVDSDWYAEALPKLLGHVGAGALDAVSAYLHDRTRWVWGRAAAAETLEAMVEQSPELRDAAVHILTDELRHADENDSTLNGSLLGSLLDLKAVEALPVIRAALEKNFIDESVAGDWREVLDELGQPIDPDDPLLKKPPFRPSWPFDALQWAHLTSPPTPSGPKRLPAAPLASKKGGKAKQKQRRKASEASRKANRAKKKRK